MDAADLLPGRAGGHRRRDQRRAAETYAIAGPRGSGVIGINGAAAHLVHPGDLVIIIAYGTLLPDAEARTSEPKVVFVDADNRIVDRSAATPGACRPGPRSAGGSPWPVGSRPTWPARASPR